MRLLIRSFIEVIDPIAGKTYIIKLASGKLVRARFDYKESIRGYSNVSQWTPERKSVSRYRFTNLESGREISLKSRLKIRAIVENA